MCKIIIKFSLIILIVNLCPICKKVRKIISKIFATINFHLILHMINGITDLKVGRHFP